jgi:hypothetical protein
MIQIIATTPLAGMKPGTSGLRKKVAESRQEPTCRTSYRPFSTRCGTQPADLPA